MKITFLGTGTSTGVPVIGCHCTVCDSTDMHDKRMRSSILWEIDGVRIVIDAGPDFRTQMIQNHIDTIDAILITHMHYDHVGGLDDVRGFNYSQNIAIDIYAEQMHADAIKQMLPYVFVQNKYPGVPQIDLHIISEQTFTVKNVNIIPIRVMHGKMPIFGYRINNWAYITDASYISPESLNKLKGCDTLIINALRDEEHISHFSVKQALAVIESIAPRRAYLTHISHQFGLHSVRNPLLPKGVEMAYDGLIINEN